MCFKVVAKEKSLKSLFKGFYVLAILVIPLSSIACRKTFSLHNKLKAKQQNIVTEKKLSMLIDIFMHVTNFPCGEAIKYFEQMKNR